MDFFPLFAALRGQPCLLVGGGDVAARKASELLAAGARLTVNANACSPAMQGLLVEHPDIELREGGFEPRLVGENLLVIAATADRDANRAVATVAREARRLCNVVDDGPASTFIVPATVDRSPVVIAISSGGRAPVLSRLLRQQLEQWLPARLGALAEWAGRWREAARRRVADPSARRRAWERLLGGPAAASVLGGDESRADAIADTVLGSTPDERPAGRAWLVGAGPGSADLISLRGLRALQSADVVLHDRLVAPELLRAARREAVIIEVGKTGGGPSTDQAEINRLLLEQVKAGRRVCRLKGGDPLIFGRGSEEALALAQAGLPFEIVPGITAASGCGAHAGIPLTHRDCASAVTLVTAQSSDGGHGPDWAWLAAARHTLAIYMGTGRVAEIAAALVRHGRAPDTPAALVSRGTTAGQQVLKGTLADIGRLCEAGRPASPGLLLVGETVAFAEQLAWQHEPEIALPPGAAPAPASQAFVAG